MSISHTPSVRLLGFNKLILTPGLSVPWPGTRLLLQHYHQAALHSSAALLSFYFYDLSFSPHSCRSQTYPQCLPAHCLPIVCVCVLVLSLVLPNCTTATPSYRLSLLLSFLLSFLLSLCGLSLILHRFVYDHTVAYRVWVLFLFIGAVFFHVLSFLLG